MMPVYQPLDGLEPLNDLDVVLMSMEEVVSWIGHHVHKHDVPKVVRLYATIKPGLIQSYETEYRPEGLDYHKEKQMKTKTKNSKVVVSITFTDACTGTDLNTEKRVFSSMKEAEAFMEGIEIGLQGNCYANIVGC